MDTIYPLYAYDRFVIIRNELSITIIIFLNDKCIMAELINYNQCCWEKYKDRHLFLCCEVNVIM